MTNKNFIRTMMRITYIPSIALPILALAAAGLFGFMLSLPMVFALMTLSGLGMFFATPQQYQQINWDNALPNWTNAGPLLTALVSPMAYMVARLDMPVDETSGASSLGLVFAGMLVLLVSMISSMLYAWLVARRYKAEYTAYTRAKTEEAINGELESLVATLPPIHKVYVMVQLKDATPAEIAEVAKAFETLREKLPHVLTG